MTDQPVQPTTAQLVEAFAGALLPLAGPYGVAASAVMTAGLQFLANLQATNVAVLTMEDLEAVAAKTTDDLDTFRKAVDTKAKKV